jgi:hypothetical protein
LNIALAIFQYTLNAVFRKIGLTVRRNSTYGAVEIFQPGSIPFKVSFLEIHGIGNIPAAVSPIVKGIHEPPAIPDQGWYAFVEHKAKPVCPFSIHRSYMFR